jgi:hydroxybutyrate-dimer hydrolase
VGRSSGGGGAIKGAEADTEGYFDGVVVFEPAINPVANPKVRVQRGGMTYQSAGKSINDYFAMIAVYMPCAGRADPTWPGHANLVNGDNLCASLREKGLVTGNTVAEQARDATRILVQYGFDPESLWEFPANGAADPLPRCTPLPTPICRPAWSACFAT